MFVFFYFLFLYSNVLLATHLEENISYLDRNFYIEKAYGAYDFDQIAQVVSRAYQRQPFNKVDYPAMTAIKLESLLKDPSNALFLLISNAGDICGTVMLRGCEISMFAVHPDYQGQGLGRHLLYYAEEEAFKNHHTIFLKVIPLFQEDLILYYKAAGYMINGHEPLLPEKFNRIQEQYHDQIYAVIMRKEKT